MNCRYDRLDEICEELGCKCICGEVMSRHTTFRVGGPADRFLVVENKKALCRILKVLNEENIPFYTVGNGSDLLVPDEGYRGVIITLAGDFKKITLENGHIIRCGAAASLAAVCAFARDNSLTGLEFAWGIPASAGGAAYMNAGAYGGEMKQVLHSCTHVTPDGEEGMFAGDDLALSYRKSVYTGRKDIITELTLILEKGSESDICAKMNDYMGRRKSKQPLEYPSAGSTFKRPEGYFAGGLIEECGLKGRAVGGAQVSEKHAGFVINTGGATCADILELVGVIKDTVKKEKGVDLEMEVKVLR